MTGGHGVGVMLAKTFTMQYGMVGTMKFAMASATFGLAAGPLIGRPVTRRLIKEYDLRPEVDKPGKGIGNESSPLHLGKSHERISINDIQLTILQISGQ